MTQTIDHKVSVSQIMPGVSVSLNARPPACYDVVVFSSVGDEPSQLYDGLLAIGFTSRGPGAERDGGIRKSFGRDGSGMHGGWTGPERERFMAEARRALRGFGFAFVPEIPHLKSTSG